MVLSDQCSQNMYVLERKDVFELYLMKQQSV